MSARSIVIPGQAKRPPETRFSARNWQIICERAMRHILLLGAELESTRRDDGRSGHRVAADKNEARESGWGEVLRANVT